MKTFDHVAWVDEHDRQRLDDRGNRPPRVTQETFGCQAIVWLGQCRACGEYGIGPCPCHARRIVKRMVRNG